MVRLSKNALQRSHDELESNLTATRSEVASLKSCVAQMTADAAGIQCQLEATKVYALARVYGSIIIVVLREGGGGQLILFSPAHLC